MGRKQKAFSGKQILWRKNKMTDGAFERTKEKTYQYFVRCCHDYLTNSERLSSISKKTGTDGVEIVFTKDSELVYVLYKSLKEQVSFVETSFRKLNEKDPILARIMYLNLVEKKTFDEIGKQRLVEVSRRSASRKYAKKHWEEFFNKTVLG